MIAAYSTSTALSTSGRALPILAIGMVGAMALSWVLRYRARNQKGLTYRIVPPSESKWDPAAWIAFYRTLFGMSAPWWKRLIVGQPWTSLEFWNTGDGIVLRCWFPERLQTLLLTHLRMALPGVEATLCTVQLDLGERAARERLHLWRDDLYPLGLLKADPLRPILGALAATPEGVVQLVIAPDVSWQGRAQQRLARLSGLPPSPGFLGGAVAELLGVFFGWLAPRRAINLSPSTIAPPSDKAGEPGYRAELRLRVSAPSKAEAGRMMHSLASAFRSLDGSNGLRPHRVWLGKRFDRALLLRLPPSSRSPVLVAEELARLFHLPCEGVEMDSAPVRVPPPRLLAASGKTLCLADVMGGKAIRIAQADCRHHIHVLGPTGSGKSTLLLNLALSDIQAGAGVGVIDPKGDLIRALLERIPDQHAERIVLIDPTARDQPIGLNVLDCADPDERELVCDGIVAIFKKTYERFWGPRTDDILRAAILTLLREPGATLCEIPVLLINHHVRRKLTKDLLDPVGLKPFWEEYERIADGQRLQLIGPVLNKLRTFLLRPTIRNILGQSTSTIQMPAVLDGKGILLVSLAKGLLGEDTSRLLGSFIVARIWQAAMHRADRTEDLRPDFHLYLDEFQNYLHLPQSLDDLLAEARGYRLNLTLANQHLAQLSPSTREALAANARTRVMFQCGQDDAHYLAREFEPHLTERGLRNLQRFQVAVRLCTGGHTGPAFTGLTAGAPPSLGAGHATAIADASLRRYGRRREQVVAAIEARFMAVGMRQEAVAMAP